MAEFADKVAALTDEQLFALLSKKNQQSKLLSFCKRCYTTPDKVRALTQSLRLLEHSSLINQVCSELVGVIVGTLTDLTDTELHTLGQAFITSLKQDHITSGKSLEVLSALLSVIEQQSAIEDFTGLEYKSHLINEIASVRWSQSSLLPLMTTLRDVNLTPTEIQFVTTKVLTTISSTSHSDLPPIIYQLLLYANKPANSVLQKRKILVGIVKHFDQLDKSVSSNADEFSADILSADPEELWAVEGTCLLHILYAIKHDLVLGKALNQYLKDLKDYTPFSVALALSFSQLPRFTDKVLTSLKTGITRNLKTKKLWDASNFVRGKFPEPVDIRSVLSDVIMRSGWDHVTQGLISLAFLLLDIPDTADEPSVASVGVVMLEQCYKLHTQCKTEVFSQLLHRIVTSTPLPSDKHSQLLSTLSRRSLQLMMTQTNQLKDSLSHVPLIPVRNATAVLAAFVPVMRYQVQLRDYAIVIFRKALFSKDQNSRIIAVIGLTEMLKYFKVGESCSQQSQLSSSQVQVHMMLTDDVHEAVCTEILLLLKRALTLQGGVRCELYQRLPSVLSSNPLLSPVILQLLHDHLTPLYEEDEGILPPLRLSDCIHVLPDHSLLREPLPDLLLCVIQCVQAAQHCDTLDQLRVMLVSITQRSTKADLEDWGLDKAAEFSTTGVGSRNSLTALTLSALLEVVLEHTLMQGESTVHSAEQFKKLFNILTSLQELIKDKQGAPKFGKKAKHSYFSTEGLQFLLNALICDEQAEHEGFVTVIRATSHSLTWALGLALEKIKLIEGEGKSATQTLTTFAKCMLIHLAKQDSPYRETASTVLAKCVVTMTTLYKEWLEEFVPAEEGLWTRLKGLFEAALEAEDYDEAQSYLTAIRAIAVQEPQAEVTEWLETLLKSSTMSSALAKEVVSLTFTLHRLSKDDLSLHTLLSSDVLTVCDVEVEECDAEERGEHGVVTRQSASRIAAATATAVDRVIHDIEWCLHLGCDEDQADALCVLLLQAAQVAVPLLSARISHGGPLDLTIKCAKQLYTALTVFIKHETNAVTARNTLRSLEKLAKYVGQSLNPALYSSLNYLQTDNMGRGKKTVSAVKRQAISLPGVVYAVEQCERHLILLSTKAKTVDLMEHFKRSTARDFRIVTSVVEQTLNKEEERPKKKRKKNDSSSEAGA